MTQTAPLATSSTNHPLPLPGGVTHFKLLKGGLRGTDCLWTNANGVATDKIPIENFDVDWITGTFGFDRDYRVQFFQNDPPGSGSWKAKGSYRKFGIEGEVAEGVTSVEGPDGGLVPRQAPPSSFESIMAVMMGMKTMAQDEQRVIVETVREQSQAQVTMARDAGQQNVMMMGTFMTKMMELNVPRQGVDPALAAILASLAESSKTTNAMLARLLEDEEPELDEEEEKALEREKRLKVLTKTMREGGGIGALLTFVKDLAVEELIDYLPTLKEKFPQYIVPAMAQFQQMATNMARPAPPPPPPPPPMMAVQPYVPPPSPRPRRAPKAPPPPPPEPEEEVEDAGELPEIT